MTKRIYLMLSLLMLTPAACRTTAPLPPKPIDIQAEEAEAGRIAGDDAMRAAFEHVDRDRERIIGEWRRVTEISAPSGGEARRAAEIERALREMTSLIVERDAVGNILATRRGRGATGRAVVIDAHLDTVFPENTVLTTTVRDGRLHAPGVGDNTRNVVALLAIARALDAARVETVKDILFLFTVEEETTFKGIDHFLETHRSSVDSLIALDGGYSGFTYGGVGTNWYRHHFIGPGGHTRSRTPPYSATLALARAISRIYELPVPSDPPSNLNIGMLGAASVINAKADDAWMSLDLRSTDNRVIEDLERRIARILEEEAKREGMTVRTEVVSRASAAQLDGHRESQMVRMTEAVHHAMGFMNPPITATASNHSSAALRLGIPAISTGVSPCGDAHADTEWCEIDPIFLGIKKVMLLGVALSGLAK